MGDLSRRVGALPHVMCVPSGVMCYYGLSAPTFFISRASLFC